MSGETITDPRKGGRIRNMELTEQGTLRAIRGPVEYHPSVYEDNGGTVPTAHPYTTPMYGVCHALLEGGSRDVLLIHDDDGVHVHEGWNRAWATLIGPSGSGAEVILDLSENDGRVAFNTQFVVTPYGIVIAIQGERPYFYDGTTIAPLGFTEVPGPPSAVGPKLSNTTNRDGGAGDDETEYILTGYYKVGRSLGETMGMSRLGTIRNDTIDIGSNRANALGGTRMEGAWSAKLQWVDHWGNLSALSPQSTQASVPKEDNLTKDRRKDYDEAAQALRIQVAWADLDEGPDHCVAKNIYRTKDQLNSGIPGYFWVPPTAKASRLVAATMAAPEMSIYPDNTPDEWLIKREKNYVPVVPFRLAALAFGRMWVANTLEQPGLVRASEPGFFGTFTSDHDVFPDANGAEVTGLCPVARGLLVFTDTSTFLITQSDDGGRFLTAVLSTTSGCVAPDSAKVMQDGTAIWLGREGFFGWAGEGAPIPLSMEIKDSHIKRIHPGFRRRAVAAVDTRMGEYRCWVPYEGSQTNNLCMVYDGTGWRERDDVTAYAVCTKKDHTEYMLALGTAFSHNSLWVLDHDGLGEDAYDGTRESYVETSWLRNTRSQRYASPPRAALWLRESGSGTLNVEVMRDWREFPKLSETGEDPSKYLDYDPPPFWDTVPLDGATDDTLRDMVDTRAPDNHFTQRRPYWHRIYINLPSVETFRIRITGTGDWEFIAFIFDEQDRHAGGTKLGLPQGGP